MRTPYSSNASDMQSHKYSFQLKGDLSELQILSQHLNKFDICHQWQQSLRSSEIPC